MYSETEALLPRSRTLEKDHLVGICAAPDAGATGRVVAGVVAGPCCAGTGVLPAGIWLAGEGGVAEIGRAHV